MKINLMQNYRYLFLFVVLLFATLPFVTFGQSFTPLVGIPGVNANSTIGQYVNALYILSISIAAFLAVIKLIIAGVKYMTSDIITSKENAKKDIKGALFGLLIVLGAVLILSTINSQLTGFDILTPNPNPPAYDGGGGGGSGIPEEATVRTETCTSAIGVRLECDYFVERCQDRDRYISHQVDEERGIVICYTYPRPESEPELSPAEIREKILDAAVAKLVGDRTIVFQGYFEDIPEDIRSDPSQRPNWIEENWAIQCEGIEGDTGNVLEMVEVVGSDIRWVCVSEE